MRSLLALSVSSALLTLATSVSAQLYDNGSVVTHPLGGAGGVDASALQNVAPYNHTTYGFTSLNSAFTLADDFTVCGNWNVTGFRLYAYQTSAGSGTFTGAFVRIFRVDPRTATPPYTPVQVAFGDLTAAMTTNLLPTAGTLSSYRCLISDFTTNTARQVQAIDVTIPAIVLTPGTYWFEFGVTGSAASGPFTPPVTELDVQGTGDGMQRTAAGVWTVVANGVNPGSGCAIPFQINGTAAGQTVAVAATFGAGKAGTNGVGAWSLSSPVRHPVLGRDFALRLSNGVAGASPIVFIGSGIPGGLPVPPFGTLYVNQITSIPMPAFNATFNSTLRLAIPHGSNLCGLNLAFQGFWADAGAAGFPLGHSNGLDLVLGN